MDDQRGFDDEDGDPTEGVRIIGAEEAEKAMERGDVAARRKGAEPRYGDRPARPPAGPRPTLRFPLDASSDPTQIERPAPRPPEPRPSKPVSGPVPMPHWTEPATGEVPKVVAGEEEGEEPDDLDAWSSFASSTPRWRDEHAGDWDDAGFDDPAVLGDDDTRLGALDTSDRPTDEELFSFDELESFRGQHRPGETIDEVPRHEPLFAEDDAEEPFEDRDFDPAFSVEVEEPKSEEREPSLTRWTRRLRRATRRDEPEGHSDDEELDLRDDLPPPPPPPPPADDADLAPDEYWDEEAEYDEEFDLEPVAEDEPDPVAEDEAEWYADEEPEDDAAVGPSIPVLGAEPADEPPPPPLSRPGRRAGPDLTQPASVPPAPPPPPTPPPETQAVASAAAPPPPPPTPEPEAAPPPPRPRSAPAAQASEREAPPPPGPEPQAVPPPPAPPPLEAEPAPSPSGAPAPPSPSRPTAARAPSRPPAASPPPAAPAAARSAPPPPPSASRRVSSRVPASDEQSSLGPPAVGFGSDVRTKVIAGVAMVVVAVLAFAISPIAVLALAVVILVLSAGEYFQTVRQVGYEPVALVGVVAVGALPLAGYWKGVGALPLVLALALAAALATFLVGAGRGDRPTDSVGITLLGVAWIGLLGGFAGVMLGLPDGIGRSLLGAAIVATVANDILAFFIGRLLGTRALSNVSPNKTIEGLVGGAVATVVVTAVVVGVAPGMAPFDSLGKGLALGLAVAVVAPLGDFCQSVVKRDLGVKDMGTALPGHGGVFDRFDALLFVLPTAYYLAFALT